MNLPTEPVSSANAGPMRTDQDAEIAAPGEPGHQGQCEAEGAELRFVARDHGGHPDMGGERVSGQPDAGDHTGQHEDPQADLALQEEPRR